MKIKVHFLGILANYFGTEDLDLDLPGNSTLKDLLTTIGTQHENLLPAELWDRQNKTFAPLLFIRGKSRDLANLEESLHGEDHIYCLLPQAGG